MCIRDSVNTNEMLTAAEQNNIEGVIIIYDAEIDAAGYYDYPEMIAIASTADGARIKALSLPEKA